MVWYFNLRLRSKAVLYVCAAFDVRGGEVLGVLVVSESYVSNDSGQE